MNRDDIIRMAREAGLHSAVMLHLYDGIEAALTDSEQDELRRLQRFAALVAAHTLANIDPSKFMSYREGFEVGAAAEREQCAKVCDDLQLPSGEFLENPAAAIRKRGQV